MPTRRALLASAALAPLLAVPSAARARQATPTAAPGELLAEVAFPDLALPAGPVAASLSVVAVAPGAAGAYPERPIPPTAALLRVRAGALAIAGGPVALRRAGAAPAATPAAGEALLGPGDAAGLALAPGRTYRLRNPGPDPLVFVEAWVLGGATRPTVEPGSVFQLGDYFSLPRAARLAAAATPVVRLARAVLASDERREPAGGGVQVALGDPTGLVRGGDGAAHNITAAPMEVLTLTADLRPVGAASPVASPAG